MPPGPAYVLVPYAPAPPSKEEHRIVLVVVILIVVFVTISVVLTAVLYALVAGSLGGGGTTPIVVALGASSSATSPDGRVHYGNTSIVTTTRTLTTAQVQFSLTNGTRVVLASTAPSPSQCRQGPVISCPSPSSGWFLVLENPGGNPIATFPSAPAGSSWDTGGGGSVTVAPGDLLTVVSAVPVLGGTLTASGVGGAWVTGSVLF